ncbi:MAG: hypothetical protein KQH79_08175 [Bacteroidetes bacterium]|nr:hypothetical protein [Bacteroidota bacterium]
MGNTSTLIYLFSNFDDSELILDDLWSDELERINEMFDFIDKNSKKVPDHLIDHVISFANDYT